MRFFQLHSVTGRS